MKFNQSGLARRVNALLRNRTAEMAQRLRRSFPHMQIIALGDRVRFSLRKSARSRASVLRAISRHLKP